MKTQSFYIETHGCQMNEHDSEKIAGLLLQRGLRPARSAAAADLFILNTCSVREKAAHRVYSRLGQFRKRKQQDPDFQIGVVGCVAQQEGRKMALRIPFVDWIVGTHLYHTIPDLLEEVQAANYADSNAKVATAFLEDPAPVEIEAVERGNDFRASITIMEGCNKRCAFCVVPHTRGKERNRPARRILDDVRRAVDAGFVEVLLLGQTVNSYRDPQQKGYKFVELLSDISRIQGVYRIRFTSPHPRHFDDDLIAVLGSRENICNHVHLPLQSGSTRVLRRMRRQHDREWYLALVEKLRNCGRELALTSDMIVGFPGETEHDFEATLSAVEVVGFESMFSFKYSPRPSTEALAWEDDVPEEVKRRRLLMLQRLQREIQHKIHQTKYAGKTWEVLTEGVARDGHRRFGRTTTNKIINFSGNASPGTFLSVTITKAGANSFVGEIDTLATA